MRLYNTLSRQIEEFQPLSQNEVGLYACGFTVYDYTHLGHLRRYTMDDVLIKTLRHAGYKVKFVQNVTDVGHLSSDADTGEDKLEKGAKKYHQSVWEIAKKFEDYYWRSMDLMGNFKPDISCKATEHIEAQIDLVSELEKNGMTYVIEGDGVYFDTSKIDDYGKLAQLQLAGQQVGARLEVVPGKKNPSDFALWKFERPGENRQMVWSSPWAERGFPGWHVECSAMARQYLGDQFDIHTGGIDHIPVHHTNEIAQSEAVTGKKPVVKYWVHHNFVLVNGQKMSKSLGNFFTIDDVIKKGFHPRALRLLFLTAHYRSEMNFTWQNLAGAQKTFHKLLGLAVLYRKEQDRLALSEEKMQKVDNYRARFFAALENDLSTPEAMSVMWEMLKSNIPSSDKYDLLIDFDEVLGLGLRQAEQFLGEIAAAGEGGAIGDSDRDLSPTVNKLLEARKAARASQNWQLADQLRGELADQGFEVEDQPDGSQLLRRKSRT